MLFKFIISMLEMVY